MQFAELVNQFTLLKLTIVASLQQPLLISGFAGDMLHNNFGMVLSAVDKPLAEGIFDSGVQVKPFALMAKNPLKKQYDQGELIEFEVTLFNQCCEALPQILQALILWQQRGFIPDKRQQRGAKFKIVSITSHGPLMPPIMLYSTGRCYNLVPPYTIADALDAIYQNLGQVLGEQPVQLGAQINLLTPVRIVSENTQLREAPSPTQWFNGIARRLWLLAKAANLVIDEQPNRDEYYNSLPPTSDIELVASNTEFTDLRRYSARHKTSQNLGGLTGVLTYQQLDIYHLALLEIGRQLKVGSKTTFGFGAYDWSLLIG